MATNSYKYANGTGWLVALDPSIKAEVQTIANDFFKTTGLRLTPSHLLSAALRNGGMANVRAHAQKLAQALTG
jgi:hypothetical protein